MKNLLVSLVSDQTIPNIQLIKEFSSQVNNYLFITTDGMEKKGVRQAIIEACKLNPSEILENVKVNQFSFDDIEEKLDKVDFEQFDRIIINITGGTKVMTLAAFDYFKEVGAEIYYVTGQDDVLIKVSPGRTKKTDTINSRVNLREYLESYGFSLIDTEPSGINEEYTDRFFDMFNNGTINNYLDVLNDLRLKGRSKSKTQIESIEGLDKLIQLIEFPLSDPGKTSINKYEAKYLTGEWFEEFVAARLKKELKLSDSFIATGIQISKINKNGINVPNEMDVVFVYNNKIYTIECKTSVFYEEEQADGKIKSKSIISETLYKSDSLKQGLGLYTNTFLFILDSISEYQSKLKTHLERAELFNIKVIDRDAIKSAKSIKELLNINS